MELFHWDIETCGQYPDYTTFKQNDKRGSDLFLNKFNKMNFDNRYESVDNYYLNNAGIISTYGKICCISFGFTDINLNEKKILSYYGEDEMDIVNKFNEMLKRIESKNFTLCGFRTNYFDTPWLLHKLHKYDIKPANIISIYDKKPWDLRMIDISDIWKQKFAWAFSFDEVCYELGIDSPKQSMNGSEVHTKYWEGKLEEIKTYCESDVRCSIDVANKIYG
jgi:predicted PolB exonuclease-like 3'-5' exonuclease